ncbi:MAG: cupin domain-containing protein [Actinomycetota bacterium]|nr:cupin domain-containing protein [Actinomycetota bacterium]
MSNATAVVRQHDEGELRWFAGGGLFTIKATSAETGGSFMLFEDHVVRGKTTPLHLHPSMDEAIYVLEGEILAHVDGEQYRVGERGLLMAPRGVPHAFLVTSETAHLLCLITPGTAEAFYRNASEPASSHADASRSPDFARLHAAAQRSDSNIELLGPPPFDVVQQPAVGGA